MLVTHEPAYFSRPGMEYSGLNDTGSPSYCITGSLSLQDSLVARRRLVIDGQLFAQYVGADYTYAVVQLREEVL